MRAEFYGCVLSGKRTVNGHYLRGVGGGREIGRRGGLEAGGCVIIKFT